MAAGIVEGSIVDSPQAGVQISAKPFRNAALAKGRLASGAADAVGGVFQEVADKITQNRQARQVFDADLTMRKTYDQFNANLAKMPDEGTWLPAWQQQVQTTRDQIMDNPHLGPDEKRQLSRMTDAWEQSTTGAVNTAALHKQLSQSITSGDADSTYAAATGHLDGPGGAFTIVDAMVANHAISAPEADQRKKKLTQVWARANADQFILQHPTTEEKNMTGADWYKKLPADEQKAAVTGLNAARLRTWKENYESMLTDKIDSTTGQIPEKTIKSAIDNRQIDPIAGTNLINAQKRDDERADDGQYKYVKGLVHDPTAWRAQKPQDYAASLIQEASHIKSPTVRQQAVDDINRELDSVKKEGFTSDGPLVRTQLEMMKQNHEQIVGAIPLTGRRPGQTTYQRGGVDAVRGMSDADFREKYGPHAKKESVVADIESYQKAENRAFSERQAQFIDAVRDNPEKAKDPDWLSDTREAIERPHVEAKVKAALGGGPVKGQTATDAKGNKATWDGAKWVENN